MAEWGFLLTACVAIVLFVLNRFLTFFGEFPLKDQLLDRENWPEIIDEYSRNRSAIYVAALRKLNTQAARFYGPDPFGGQAFTRCLQLALIYPIVSIIAGWVFGNEFTLGGLIDLPNGYEKPERMWKALILFLTLLFGILIVPILNWISRKRDNLEDPHPYPYSGIVDVSFTILTFATVLVPVIFAVNMSSLTGFPPLLAALLVLAGITAAAEEFTVGFISIFFAFLFILLLMIGPFSSELDAEFFSVTLLVFCIFPFFNAIADWLSVGATRHFISKISNSNQSTGLKAVDVILDFFAAVLCLIGLLIALVVTLEVWRLAIPASLALDWRIYLAKFTAGTPGNAAPLFLMATTTLLPSFVHLVFGLAALATAQSSSTKTAIQLMKSELDNSEFKSINKIIRHFRRGQAKGYLRAFLFVGCPFILIFAALAWSN